LSKVARSLTVPVVVSIWLSVVASLAESEFGLLRPVERGDLERAPSRRRLRTAAAAPREW
jgi:hypothetical protein